MAFLKYVENNTWKFHFVSFFFCVHPLVPPLGEKLYKGLSYLNLISLGISRNFPVKYLLPRLRDSADTVIGQRYNGILHVFIQARERSLVRLCAFIDRLIDRHL